MVALPTIGARGQPAKARYPAQACLSDLSSAICRTQTTSRGSTSSASYAPRSTAAQSRTQGRAAGPATVRQRTPIIKQSPCVTNVVKETTPISPSARTSPWPLRHAAEVRTSASNDRRDEDRDARAACRDDRAGAMSDAWTRGRALTMRGSRPPTGYGSRSRAAMKSRFVQFLNSWLTRTLMVNPRRACFALRRRDRRASCATRRGR